MTVIANSFKDQESKIIHNLSIIIVNEDILSAAQSLGKRKLL